MKKIPLEKARFVKTAVKPDGYPVLKNSQGLLLPEIAVAGRSNVGKSSLLNHLFRQKHLVKTSATPGKTQALNFFRVEDDWLFVDLPGYGFAQVPQEVRKQWGPMVHGYLTHRPQLKLILFLFDIRRVPNEEDKEFLEWIAQSEKSALLILTKVDKLTRSEITAYTKRILDAFQAENLTYLHYSVTKDVGRAELIRLLIEALEDEDDTTL